MKRLLIVAALVAAAGRVAHSQIIPRLPAARPAAPRQGTRDTTNDTLRIKWPQPDSVAQRLLQLPGYTVTRFQGDTAFFNQERRSLDLLAGKGRRAAVTRDSQTVVSDSGIYYLEATRDIKTGGRYVLSSPGSGQADITGVGRIDYSLAARSARITNARLPVNNGEIWYIDVAMARVTLDSSNSKGSPVWAKGGTITSCDDSIPDYHFAVKEIKKSGNILAARPAVLYIKDVPVMWLPFFFSDQQPGRHSGILAPQFGVGDIVRNSPTYRRSIEHLGYYWALNNYMDFGTWLDWRSSAGSTQGDPGWLRLNGDWNYKWLDRFMGGRVGLAYTDQRNGQTNTAISWAHQQEFSHDSRLNTNFNYVTSTDLQRQNTFNPYASLATISSQASYQTKFGPASVSVGATQKQYPGRPQLDRTFPTVTLSTTAISLGSHVSWTPGLSFSRSDVLHMDQPGVGAFTYTSSPTTGVLDSTLNTSRNSSNASITLDTPFEIFGKTIRNSFRINQQRNNFPQQFQIFDVETGAITDTRVFASTYRTDIDWNPDFSIPALASNKFNLTPSVSLANVDPGPFWVATDRTNGHYVSQRKRLTFGVSASPTLFGLFPGFGPFQRLRHSIQPTLGFTYAPKADVPDEYLRALNRTRVGYLGGLQQNSVTFGLNQNLEAKVKPRANDTTGTDKGEVIRLLSISTTPLNYDFVRASQPNVHSKLSGFTTETWGYTLSSDLLPGFDFTSSYSLFQGSTLSDTAVFKPYLTNVSASLNFSRDLNPIVILSRIFGRAVPQSQTSAAVNTQQVRPQPNEREQAVIAAQPVAGSARSGDRFLIPPSQGWRASFTFARSSPRPPTGNNVIDFDPKSRCAQIAGNDPFLLDACLAQQRAAPTTDTPVNSTIAGGPAYKIPPTTSLNGSLNFNLTPKWTAAWQTTYDFEQHQFASHIVSLQRDLHDWRAIFGFTQSPNGNFAFNFMIALKAEPDLKFDYNKATVRSGSTVPF